MTDVYIVTLAILGFLITSPGLAAAVNLFFPRVTETAYRRITETPVKSFLAGLGVTAVTAVWVIAMSALGGPMQGVGIASAILWLGVLTVGTSAMARLLGARLAGMMGGSSELGNIIRGAVIYELASLVPLVGWFLFTPLMSCMAVGAALFGLVRWAPRVRAAEPGTAALNAAAD